MPNTTEVTTDGFPFTPVYCATVYNAYDNDSFVQCRYFTSDDSAVDYYYGKGHLHIGERLGIQFPPYAFLIDSVTIL